MGVTTLRIMEWVIQLGITIFCVLSLEPRLLGLEFPWNILVCIVAGYIPVLLWNKFAPAKCPNKDCGNYTLFKEQIYPSRTSNGYDCKECGKKFYYKMGVLNEGTST